MVTGLPATPLGHTLDNMAATLLLPVSPPVSPLPSVLCWPVSSTPPLHRFLRARVKDPRGCFYRRRRREYPQWPETPWGMAYTVQEPSTLRVPLVFRCVGRLYVHVCAHFARFAGVQACRESVSRYIRAYARGIDSTGSFTTGATAGRSWDVDFSANSWNALKANFTHVCNIINVWLISRLTDDGISARDDEPTNSHNAPPLFPCDLCRIRSRS